MLPQIVVRLSGSPWGRQHAARLSIEKKDRTIKMVCLSEVDGPRSLGFRYRAISLPEAARTQWQVFWLGELTTLQRRGSQYRRSV
jgi:hypothetical protein